MNDVLVPVQGLIRKLQRRVEDLEDMNLGLATESHNLQNALEPFKKAARKMAEFNHDKPPIVHKDDWLRLNDPKQ